MVPGTYQAVAVGPSVGHHRFEFTVRAGQQRTIPVRVEENLAAAGLGATAVGDGTGAQDLLDGTESSEWSAEPLDRGERRRGARRERRPRRRLRPAGQPRPSSWWSSSPTGCRSTSGTRGVSAFYEAGSRFSALRQFAIGVCDTTRGATCTEREDYDQVFVSSPDAFPSDGMRPTSPDLNAQSFAIPQSRATHVRLEVLSNQCTGGEDFQDDSRSSTRESSVRIE